MNLEDIKRAAEKLAKVRAHLTSVAAPYKSDFEDLQRRLAKAVSKIADREKQAVDELMDLLRANEAAFTDKKSLEVNGVKCGFRMGQESITVGEGTVDLIVEHGDAERFLRTIVEPNKEALSALTDEQLARIDCARVPKTNKPFVQADKVLDGMFKAMGYEA